MSYHEDDVCPGCGLPSDRAHPPLSGCPVMTEIEPPRDSVPERDAGVLLMLGTRDRELLLDLVVPAIDFDGHEGEMGEFLDRLKGTLERRAPPPSAPGLYWVLLREPDGVGGGEPTVIRYQPHDGQIYGPDSAVTVLGNDLTFSTDVVRVWGPRIEAPADLGTLARP